MVKVDHKERRDREAIPVRTVLPVIKDLQGQLDTMVNVDNQVHPDHEDSKAYLERQAVQV